jgi:hypothetical protein
VFLERLQAAGTGNRTNFGNGAGFKFEKREEGDSHGLFSLGGPTSEKRGKDLDVKAKVLRRLDGELELGARVADDHGVHCAW